MSEDLPPAVSPVLAEDFREPVDNPPHPLLNYSIKPLERLTGLITKYDLVNHWLKASLSLGPMSAAKGPGHG
jgi:hypothetical protein